MTPVIRLQKVLLEPVRQPEPQSIGLRTYCPGDERHWLRLHRRCFLTPWAPAWEQDDFTREFFQRAWWSGERMAFAVTPSRGMPIGTITVSGLPAPQMHIAWLAVDPRYRRRQAGRKLLHWVEATIWDLGGRCVVAETLASWQEAVTFYEAMGYVRESETPPMNLP